MAKLQHIDGYNKKGNTEKNRNKCITNQLVNEHHAVTQPFIPDKHV
jgi:hypothetical protein